MVNHRDTLLVKMQGLYSENRLNCRRKCRCTIIQKSGVTYILLLKCLWKLSRGLYKKQAVCKCNQAK
uniref:Uncharacterized protein n=1 Tax=Arundo donax TaxID=35708 RepID=A0A0A9AB77_ARUDO